MVVMSPEKQISARLHAMPPFEDVTRRGFLFGAAGLPVLAPYECSGGGSASEGGAGDKDRHFEDDAGEVVKIPTRPVESGRVERVDGFLWPTAGSVPGGLAIVEDLRKAFIA